MQLRDAVAPIPDHSVARRVAVATGILTAVAIGGAIAAICSSSPRPPTIPTQLPTLAVASLYAGPAVIARANNELRSYAFETYPAWASEHPLNKCPYHLLELNRYAPSLHAVDPWGSPYQFICGKQYGPVLSMRSAGPDRKFETSDDLSTAP